MTRAVVYHLSVPDYTGGARVTRLRRQTDTDTRPEWTFCVPSFGTSVGSRFISSDILPWESLEQGFNIMAAVVGRSLLRNLH